MSSLRWPLRLYVAGVIVAGVIALAAAINDRGAMQDDPFIFATLFVMATVARLQVVHVGTKMKMNVGDTATFAAAIVLGPLLAMLVAGGSSLIGQRFSQRIPLYNRFFNASGSALAMGAASFAYDQLSSARTAAMPVSPMGLAVAAIVGYGLKTLLVDVAVGIQLRRNPFANLWARHRSDLPHHGALYSLGALAALSIDGHTWALGLFLVPMLLVLLVLRETARLRGETKTAITELADLIESRDTYTYGHSLRVAQYANRLARRLKMQPSQIDLVTEAARLHDIGKITTPEKILQKPGPLEPHEMEEMRKHTEAGYELLRRMGDFWDGALLIRSHHERPDGSGYPRGLAGMELPLEASVISVCDAYDAMTSDRVYRKALPFDRVLAELHGGRGTQWHVQVVDALIEMVIEDRSPESALGAALGHAALGAHH